ncbi:MULTISPECIES: hypothetical protein [unclassified Corynebacterium]|uniref:hypothetical protein n=1 Tax=unclassified Corynebacterium TaxID=2624378 RepID=UPI00264AAB63|nr:MULTISPECIES: hypothetical protein [unclassified Corynebacterium]MDN8595335.1 hypothetical protein [Corynebacterium sp. P4_F2]WKK54820.1 hypothetical protein QYR03_06140 [Corynebacterium sp. P4-C1]WKK64197.1 hypothetical protein QYR04_04760 [Corynebacterium sp. P8-C1]
MDPKFTGGSDRSRNTANMDDLQASDAFLTDLSHGVDPSGGSDELAALLLGLHDEVAAPMPAAPDLSELFGGSVAGDDAVTEENPAVASLGGHRARRGPRRAAEHTKDRGRRFRTNPWLAGLVGAAAATVMVAGTGAALYNATPGSALWGPSETLFGERTDSVEFASALDEIDSKTQSGDIAGARVLIDQLRDSLKSDRERKQKQQTGAPAPQAPATVTVSREPKPEGKPAEPEKPATVTVTPAPATQTVTVTETAPAHGGRGTESSSSSNAPSTTSTIPTTTKSLGASQQSQPAQSSQ